ncbi:MAG: hypothetical protein KGJ92_03255 [Actinomycetales bacterium]|nr:hypothetical protein [Actinomycetales bacterium]
MTNDERRIAVATRLRALGHAFVDRDLSDDELDRLAHDVDALLARVEAGGPRTVSIDPDLVEAFTAQRLDTVSYLHEYLVSDSVVAGGANPMGLGARHWRDGDVAVMEAVIGKAFEGAPGRSHGGIIATLIDETMGFVLGLHGLFALTARLVVTYRAAAPVGQSVVARAWLERQDGRKLTIGASVTAGDVRVADAEALFITVDVTSLLDEPESN